jgi:uncharacterized SAM-binding protein YcdF (DUF218 family)
MDDPVLTSLLSGWFLPPANALLLLAGGLLAYRWRPRLALALLVCGAGLLYVASAPVIAFATVRALEPPPLDPARAAAAGAIVVLSSGTYVSAPEYGADTATAGGLERIRYAAHVQRATGLPVLVTGGKVWGASVAEGTHMGAVLERELDTPVRWVEPTGTTTWSSAVATRGILSEEGIDTVVLVTHAWHMRRAAMAFEHAGFTVVPAPTAYATYSAAYPPGFIPTSEALAMTRNAWREAIGIAWYRLRASLLPRI